MLPYDMTENLIKQFSRNNKNSRNLQAKKLLGINNVCSVNYVYKNNSRTTRGKGRNAPRVEVT